MKHLSKRAKIGTSALGTLALVGALAAAVVPTGLFASASPAQSAATSFNGHAFTSITQRATGGAAGKLDMSIKLSPAGVSCTQYTVNDDSGCTTPRDGDSSTKVGSQSTPSTSKSGPTMKNPRPAFGTAFNYKGRTVSTSQLPLAGDSPLVSTGATTENFNGVSDLDQATANGGQGWEVTPPDQALCLGAAGPLENAIPFQVAVPATLTVAMEQVNDGFAVYSTTGKLLAGPYSIAPLYEDANASGDVRCTYDAVTHTFFNTEIGVADLTGSGDYAYVTDVTVISPTSAYSYWFDTSEGGYCFPDYPQQGFDSHAFYLTVNEFCGASEAFAGTSLFTFPKSALINPSSGVPGWAWFNLALGGNPVMTLQPAFGNAYGVEYLLNSFPYDKFGNSNSVANLLGQWEVDGDQYIAHPTATHYPTLHAHYVKSEMYAFPQPAASTGDGTTICVPFVVEVNCTGGILSQSEPFLATNDDRIDQVEVMKTAAGPRLYSSLETAIALRGDSTARNAAAWFEIDPVHHTTTRQGYVAAKGTYLDFPSIMRGAHGTLVLSFTMTSRSLNPSTGYAYLTGSGTHFSSIHITGHGTGPHYSFAGPLVGRIRWGDYSAASLNPSTGDVWQAGEYIPAIASQDPVDNWGTRVYGVKA